MNETWVSLRGLKIYVKTVGAGDPLVFLHGGPGAEHGTFLPHVEELSNEFTLVFYDQRGCGKSERARTDASYTINDEVETLEELRQYIGVHRLNLVGESWGTMLALMYAARYPENVGKLLLSSAIGASMVGYQRFEDELLRRMTPEDKTRLETITEALEREEGNLEDLFAVLDPYYVYSLDTLARNSKTVKNPAVNAAFDKELRSQYDLREKLDRLCNIPVKVLLGSHDMLCEADIRELLLQYLPHATLQIIPQCGHWIYVEQTDAFNEAVRQFFRNGET